MARELPRTVRSLAADYQREIATDDYEVIVVDNGSPDPVNAAVFTDDDVPLRVLRIDDAPPSPAHAANVGLASAAGDIVGLVIDGARIASPGLLMWARRSMSLAVRPVVTAPAWHLGPTLH